MILLKMTIHVSKVGYVIVPWRVQIPFVTLWYFEGIFLGYLSVL